MKARLERMNEIRLYQASKSDIFLIDDEKETKLKNESGTVKVDGIDFSREYFIKQDDKIYPLIFGDCVRDDEFDKKFYFSDWLGFQYSEQRTEFRIWAPIAHRVILLLNDIEFEMSRKGGVYFAAIEGDYEGSKYKYLIRVNHEWVETTDPYAISSAANGEYNYVIDIEKTRINMNKQKLPKFTKYTDSILYEVHIRDFTIADDTVDNKGTYIGMLEGERGLNYIKELGITHVQLMPIFDFHTVDELNKFDTYNWGYDPWQYNVPEGSYSKNPNDPYSRINELKQLISEAHKKGLRINLDVVYNHVYDYENHPFNKIVPGYYFRHDEFGNMSNGTGCENDTECKRRMVSKFIKDSVTYWAKEYAVDGFRIDLMGTHNTELINEIYDIVKAIDRNAMVYGEGWNIATMLNENERAIISNHKDLEGVAFFNDRFRDYIKGDLFIDKSKGFLLSDDYTKQLVYLLKGSSVDGIVNAYFSEPSQSINYIECHDDLTLYDKLLDVECDDISTKQKLAIGLILLSQGIPFIHSGMEFMRTKQGEHNSYKSADEINKIDWDLLEKNRDVFEFTRELIKIRKMQDHFRFSTVEEVIKYIDINIIAPGIVEYNLFNGKKMTVLINSSDKEIFFKGNIFDSKIIKIKG